MISRIAKKLTNLRKFHTQLFSNRQIAFFLYDMFALRGYQRSVTDCSPIDAVGSPLPWYTYPAIEYLSQFDYSQKRMFEYGCGMSTLFWEKRVQDLVSVEDELDWQENIQKKVSSTVIFEREPGAYADAPVKYGTFDVIVIDGSYRNACVSPAVRCLREGGMIIADNTDWFPEVTRKLRAAGLLQVDFHGLGPCNGYAWVTSVFFHRSFNFPFSGEKLPLWSIGGVDGDCDHEG